MEMESVIQYPVDFPIKIMGKNQAAFVSTITALVRRHAPDFNPDSAEVRSSREGKYLSVTATICATSRQQLDELYQELSDHPMVTMVL